MQKARSNPGPEFFAWGAALALPFLLAVSWFNVNRAYPIYDAADYFGECQKIYQIYLKSGWLAALAGGYLNRGWRPVSLPLLGFPFLVLSHGAVLAAIRSLMLVVLGVLSSYAYLLIRSRRSRTLAILGTWFVLTQPWLIQSAFVFQTEFPFLCVLVAAAYHLTRSSFLRERRHSIFCGGFLALAATLRPVETGLLAAVPLLILTCFRVREKTHLKSLGWFYGCFLGMTAAWYLPALRELYFWIYVGSFGDFVKVFGIRIQGAAFLRLVLSQLIGYAGTLLILLGGLSLGRMIRRRGLRRAHVQALLGVAGAVSFPLAVGCFSLNSEARFFFGAILVLMISSFLLASGDSKLFLVWGLVPFIGLQSLMTWEVATQSNVIPLSGLRRWVSWKERVLPGRSSPVRGKDPAIQLFEDLHLFEPLAKDLRVGVIRMVHGELSRLMEFQIFQVIAGEAGSKWSFGSYLDFERRTQQAWALLLRERFDMLIVGEVGGSEDKWSVSSYGAYLLESWKNETLSSTGWRFRTLLPVMDEYGNSGGFLVLSAEVNPKR